MMNIKRTLLAAIAAAGLFAAANTSAAVVSLNNQNFETGTLSGWTAIGSAFATNSTSVTTNDNIVWNIGAADTTMAQLDSGNSSIASIELALGLTSGVLNTYNTNANGGDLTDGSAIYQSFVGNIGDTLAIAWDYVARDYIPFNDPAFAIIINPDGSAVIDVLASIHGLGMAVGTSGHTGWQTFSETLTQTGTFTIAFVTTNDKDTALDAALFIDNVAGTCTPTCPPPVNQVPEPGSLALLGLGLGGLAVARRRSMKSA